MSFNISVFCAHFVFTSLHFSGQDQAIMALAFNDNNIIYYYMDTQWSIGLGQIIS